MQWVLCGDDFVYVDAGLSAKTTDRPAFQRMIADAGAGKFQRVVSVALDRLARSTRDFLAVVDVLDRAGVAIVLLKQNFDTGTPQGRFALTMFAALAELEAANDLRPHHDRAHRKGAARWLQRRACALRLRLLTAKPSRRMVMQRRSNASSLTTWPADAINRIADNLNTAGIPTATKARWYASTVSYVLHNGFYAGTRTPDINLGKVAFYR